MTAIFAVTFVMSAVLICKWTLSHYDDDDDDGDTCRTFLLNSISIRFETTEPCAFIGEVAPTRTRTR